MGNSKHPLVGMIMHVLTWGQWGKTTGIHSFIRGGITLLLMWFLAILLFSGCTKKSEDQAVPAPTEHAQKKPSWAGGPGGPNGGGGGGGNPNNPPAVYEKVIDTVDFNFALDTLTCGKLHLTWTTPVQEPNLRQFLKHGSLTNTCTGPEVIGDNVLIDYNAGCAFNVGETYHDVYMWAFYRATSNDTTYTYEFYSTQTVSQVMGSVPSSLCN